MITEDLLRISCNQGVSSSNSSRINQFVGEVSGCYNGSTESDDAISELRVTPGGHRHYVPICVYDDCKPAVNKVFNSLEQGMNFYKEYGRMCGFDTRRSTEQKETDGTILVKYVVCSRAGFKEEKKNVSDCTNVKAIRRRTVSNRCGCNAKIILKICGGQSYRVVVFIENHNHDLVSKVGRQFLRVSRQMSYASRKFVFDAAKVNIGASQSYRLMKEMVGGYANIGATVREYRNFTRDLKEFVGERDAQMIIEKFKVKHDSNETFYYGYDVDGDGHLTKLFWADSIARRNYELYGDAVSFDATFDTNMYNMVFCPFTGVDKNDKCVTFAFALLSKEDIQHFQWAFDHLLKAMGRNPVVIITDQCPAMKQAIPLSFPATDEFPATRHRLCMWHILEKFPIKLGNYLCKETDFMTKMKSYIWSSTLEPYEFEKGWKAVLKEFKLEGHKWLWEMYAIRTSWIPTFFRDKPMFGLMRTTSRSESENNFFSQFHRRSDTLCEFYLRFESAMDKQRHESCRLNEEARSAIPSTVSTLFLEEDAAQLYTRPIFYKIQEEILAACYDMRIIDIGPLVDGFKTYKMKDVKMKEKLFEVIVGQNHAECSCKKFVMCGILCRHAFCALNQFEVVKIPRNLVLNRWSRLSENRPSSKFSGVADGCVAVESVSLKVTNIWFNFQKAMNQAGGDVEKLSYVDKMIKQLGYDLGNGSGTSKKAQIEEMIGPQPTEEISILAPNQCKNKGSGLKRFISQREKAIRDGNKRPRRCKLCSSVLHDARKCSLRKKSGSVDDTEVATVDS